MRILCFDIGGTFIKIGLIDQAGNILELRKEPTKAEEGGEVLMNRLLSFIGEYRNIDRIGISTAGQVDANKGSIVFATDNLPGWTGMKIKERIENLYGIITAVDNDVNCAALGEAIYGSGKENDSFLALTFGTGIGGAIIENKEIYRGKSGVAGEFGHIVIHGSEHSDVCTCGGYGCYEVYASTKALLRRVKKKLVLKKDMNGFEIIQGYKNGHREIVKEVQCWMDDVVIGLINLIYIFNPNLIILGGGIMEECFIIDYICDKVKAGLMISFKDVTIKPASLGNNAGLLGASINAMKMR